MKPPKDTTKSSNKVSRRAFLKAGLTIGAGVLAPWQFDLRRGLMMSQVLAAQSPQTLLPGSSIPQFVDELPNLHTIIDEGTQQITLTMQEFQSRVMPSTFKPKTGTYTGTWVGDTGTVSKLRLSSAL